MEKNRPILVRVHTDLEKARAYPRRDDIGGVGLKNPTIAAQQIQNQQIGDPSAIGEAPPFDPGHPSVGDLAADLGKEPRLTDARLTDETDGLAVSIFYLPKEIVQDRELALAIDKDCRTRRRRLAQSRPAMGNTEQT